MFRSTVSFLKRIAAGRAPRTDKPLGRWSKPETEDQLARRVQQTNEDHCGGSMCTWEERLILREARGAWLAYNQTVLKKEDKSVTSGRAAD